MSVSNPKAAKARTAKKDASGFFDSVLVHLGESKARFQASHLKVDRSVITVPSAWPLKLYGEIEIRLELPAEVAVGKKGKRVLQTRGMVLECRQVKDEQRYDVDVLLTELTPEQLGSISKITPKVSLPVAVKSTVAKPKPLIHSSSKSSSQRGAARSTTRIST